jgi:hypothetical protein
MRVDRFEDHMIVKGIGDAARFGHYRLRSDGRQ